jgi:adenine-specific DNA-methyltransferase
MEDQKLSPEIFDASKENLKKLEALFPSAVKDGQLDLEALKQELGEFEEVGKEKYELTWTDKNHAKQLAMIDIQNKTLNYIPEDSKNPDSTENLYIEGDNLEVLKLLRKSYYSKIKMIYIDPPYNTGNDFVYNDNFNKNRKESDIAEGIVDEEGNPLQANSKSSNRYHANWLNMMYPRLKIARDLLTDDGVIFISIDDNEVANLKKICDEIFGEDNFIAIFPWKKRTAKSDVPFGISQDFEWIVTYAKGSFTAGIRFERRYYQSSDFPNDRWRLSDLTTQKIEADRPNSAFDLIDPKTKKVYKYNPNRLWGITRDTFQDYYEKGKIVFPMIMIF